MIFKIFRNEWKRSCILCVLGLAVCILASVVFGVAGLFGEDAFAARMAGVAFSFYNGASYAVPLVLLGLTVFISCYKYYRLAGIRERDIAAGELFSLFAWTAMFVLAELLCATLLDNLLFIDRDSARVLVGGQSFLLSLREHGAGRLLISPAIGVSVSVLFLMYASVRATAEAPRAAGVKVAAAVFAALVAAFYHIVLLTCAKECASVLDLSLVAVPGSLLPVEPYSGAIRLRIGTRCARPC